MTGLYIHIPFCAVKCAYCDFYSLKYNRDIVKKYVEVLCQRLINIDTAFDTVYFGGGTPSIIGADELSKILSFVKFKNGAEITVEVNPKTYKNDFFEILFKNGFNRISIGLQSGVDSELKSLTRNHSSKDVEIAVNQAKKAGFKNISLDVMIGVEGQTMKSLKHTLDFCIKQQPTHISAYMLKIEENTPFAKMNLNLPDEDEVSDMYLYLCDYLKQNGYEHYEISNFSKKGFESKHNLIYWQCENYLGLGPAAHSFINGKRYYFPNNIDYFLEGNESVFSENGGDLFDYIMLGLRLKKGLDFKLLKQKGFKLDTAFLNKLGKYKDCGLINISDTGFSLTDKGFLVQNTILCDLMEDL